MIGATHTPQAFSRYQPTKIRFSSPPDMDHEAAKDFVRKANQSSKLPNYGNPYISIPRPSASNENDKFEPVFSANPNEEKMRADFQVKFAILRSAYPEMSIPNYGKEYSIEQIKAFYKAYVRKIYVDDAMRQSSIYLYIFWIIIEAVCTHYFKIDISGFASRQLKSMNTYHRTLLELGERAAGKEGADIIASEWPPEMRLLGISVLQAVILLVINKVGSVMGKGTAESFMEGLTSLMKGRTEGVTKAEAADSDTPVDAVPEAPTNDPLGGLGEMAAQFLPMVGNMFSQKGSSTAEAPKKKPTGFASRNVKPNNDRPTV